MSVFTIAVRQLAEFCFRSGDIDYRFTPSPTALEGIEGHQRVTARRGTTYKAEYGVSEEFEIDGCRLLLRGRADGYDPGAGSREAGLVEEIKTCRVAPDQIPASVQALHRAQACLYGALICRAENLPALDVQLTYWNVDSEQEWCQVERLSAPELQDILDDALRRYGAWMVSIARLKSERDASINRLGFPHGNYRAGQREMAETTYKCIAQGGQLLLQAPTGIGKTAAVLYPAVKALDEEKHDRIVYLTARTVGRRAAEQTLDEFRRAGLRLRSLSLSARDKVCLSPGKACHGEDCPYASGYYDRLPVAMAEALQEQSLSREMLDQLALRHSVCPYQLAMDLVPWVDVLIADMNYVYSFHAAVSAMFESRGLRFSILLDEAHNLPERARDMYSASLCKADLMAARKESVGALRRALERCNRALLDLQNSSWADPDFDSRHELPESLPLALHRFSAEVSAQMGDNPAYLQQRPALMDFYFSVLQFQRVTEVFGPDYRFELHRGRGRQGLRARLNCLDASRLLRGRQALAHSVTAFSATVSPSHWVGPALGLEAEAVFLSLPSPFVPGQLKITLDTGIDTRYRARDASLPGLCVRIGRWLDEHQGNCIVYFPSYHYLEAALGLLRERLAGRTLCEQRRDQGDAQRGELIDTLRTRRDVVAFCILGGVFGEGIDLPGEELASVVVVGVGLPQFNRERQELKDYYSRTFGCGFEYAYQYPGMQKVNQALGRVVRRESDQGEALLLDTRYGDPGWCSLLPEWWEYR